MSTTIIYVISLLLLILACFSPSNAVAGCSENSFNKAAGERSRLRSRSRLSEDSHYFTSALTFQASWRALSTAC